MALGFERIVHRDVAARDQLAEPDGLRHDDRLGHVDLLAVVDEQVDDAGRIFRVDRDGPRPVHLADQEDAEPLRVDAVVDAPAVVAARDRAGDRVEPLFERAGQGGAAGRVLAVIDVEAELRADTVFHVSLHAVCRPVDWGSDGHCGTLDITWIVSLVNRYCISSFNFSQILFP